MSGEENLFEESTVTFSDLPEAKTAIKATPIALPELEISKEEVEEQNKELYKGSEARWDEFGEKHGIDGKILENILTSSSLGWSNLSPIQEKVILLLQIFIIMIFSFQKINYNSSRRHFLIY